MYTHKMLLACLATLICVSAEAQKDHPTKREARAQRNFEACVDNNARGQQNSRKAMRSIEEQCRRRVAAENNRQPLQGSRQRESEGATQRRDGQVLKNDESNTPGGTLRRKGGD